MPVSGREALIEAILIEAIKTAIDDYTRRA
jgi:hypothetical protein